MTFAQRASSARMCWPNASGVDPTPSTASRVRRSFVSAVPSARINSLLSRVTIAGGVPRGASTPYHPDISKS